MPLFSVIMSRYALLFTDLEEVMVIDADNTPIKDPAFLFDDEEYRKVGSLFWPDYWQTHPDNPIWQLTGTVASHAATALPVHAHRQAGISLPTNVP